MIHTIHINTFLQQLYCHFDTITQAGKMERSTPMLLE
jgi:hypothetical protein